MVDDDLHCHMPEDILKGGLQMAGSRMARIRGKETSLRRLRSHFGVDPETVATIYVDMQTTPMMAAWLEGPDLLCLLLTLLRLKTRKTEGAIAGLCDIDEKTAREWTRFCTLKSQALKHDKVRRRMTTALDSLPVAP